MIDCTSEHEQQIGQPIQVDKYKWLHLIAQYNYSPFRPTTYSTGHMQGCTSRRTTRQDKMTQRLRHRFKMINGILKLLNVSFGDRHLLNTPLTAARLEALVEKYTERVLSRLLKPPYLPGALAAITSPN